MGNDSFQSPSQMAADSSAGMPPLAIGEGSVIEGAIIDKNCHIGRRVRLVNERGIESSPDSDQAMICEGVVVAPKDAVLPDGWDLNAELAR
jgi:glucose-1-phosphate adenylyltransferase